MQSNRRYVVVGIVAIAALVGLTLGHGFHWLAVQFGFDDPYLFNVRELALTSVLAYGLAAAAALFVFKHQPTFEWANEVVDELSKVTWPTREETGSATVVVIVTVVICSVYLGAFDAVWLAVTDWILGINGAPTGS